MFCCCCFPFVSTFGLFASIASLAMFSVTIDAPSHVVFTFAFAAGGFRIPNGDRYVTAIPQSFMVATPQVISQNSPIVLQSNVSCNSKTQLLCSCFAQLRDTDLASVNAVRWEMHVIVPFLGSQHHDICISCRAVHLGLCLLSAQIVGRDIAVVGITDSSGARLRSW